jgi:NAD-dependent dihydropyrimidine dehydrogenase PreA subunit
MVRRHGRPVPGFLKERCMDCGGCVGSCPHDSLDLFQGFITVRASCTECDLCVRLCPVEALLSVKAA